VQENAADAIDWQVSFQSSIYIIWIIPDPFLEKITKHIASFRQSIRSFKR
jgi:hypothetical protein